MRTPYRIDRAFVNLFGGKLGEFSVRLGRQMLYPAGALRGNLIKSLAPLPNGRSAAVSRLGRVRQTPFHHLRFDWPAFLVPQKPTRQIASKEPIRSRTQRSFLKPSSTAPSSVHATPDPLRSASGFRNTRSVRISPILDASRHRRHSTAHPLYHFGTFRRTRSPAAFWN